MRCLLSRHFLFPVLSAMVCWVSTAAATLAHLCSDCWPPALVPDLPSLPDAATWRWTSSSPWVATGGRRRRAKSACSATWPGQLPKWKRHFAFVLTERIYLGNCPATPLRTTASDWGTERWTSWKYTVTGHSWRSCFRYWYYFFASRYGFWPTSVAPLTQSRAPDFRHCGLRTVPRGHSLPFAEYAAKATSRVQVATAEGRKEERSLGWQEEKLRSPDIEQALQRWWQVRLLFNNARNVSVPISALCM